MRYHDHISSMLNRKAAIMRLGKAAEKDALGQYPVEEQPVATVWAGVTPQTGSLLSGRVAEIPAVPHHAQGDDPVQERRYAGYVADDRRAAVRYSLYP